MCCVWHIEREVGEEGSEPEDGYGEVFSALAPSGRDACHGVIDEKHLQQYPSEPVSSLRGALHAVDKAFGKG